MNNRSTYGAHLLLYHCCLERRLYCYNRIRIRTHFIFEKPVTMARSFSLLPLVCIICACTNLEQNQTILNRKYTTQSFSFKTLLFSPMIANMFGVRMSKLQRGFSVRSDAFTDEQVIILRSVVYPYFNSNL